MKTSKFQRFLKLFHHLSIDVENEFKDEYSYEKRLVIFMKDYQGKVVALRKSFLIEYYKDKSFAKEYHEYMDREFDFILFVNLNITSVDQRKFSGDWYKENIGELPGNTKNPFVRFTAFWYQVVIWEFYLRYSLAYWKSRDVGLSFTIISGEIMSLLHHRGREVLFLSRVETDVDKNKDRTQTNMGRGRALIEQTVIYSAKNFYDDKFLSFYETPHSGIKGASSGSDPGRQGRVTGAFKDEAGADKKISDTKGAVTMAATNVCYAGTLKSTTDAGFREIIRGAQMLENHELRTLWTDFLSFLKSGIGYLKAWQETFKIFEKKYPGIKSFSFRNTYLDHPLKSGKSDYFDIESSRFFHDPIRIANELKADLDAGSPDRSFYSLTPDHFDELEVDDFKYYDVLMGFDPGGHKTAAACPIIIDEYGCWYILPVEIFNKGSMVSWIDSLKNKYGKFTIFAENSVKAYGTAGSGWMSAFRKVNIRVINVSNRDMDDQLLVVNEMFRQTEIDESGEEVNKVTVDEKNKWFAMSYIYGEKYSDERQKEMSHPAEAMIAPLFHLNKSILEIVNGDVDYGY